MTLLSFMQPRIGEIALRNYIARLVFCAVGGIVVVSCSNDANTAAPPTGLEATVAAAVTTEPGTDIAPGVVNTIASFSPLEALLVNSLPDGYVQVDDVEADTGPSNLSKAVSDDGGVDGEAVLIGAGFMNGHQRLWQNGDQTSTVYIRLYEFSNANGAATYRDREIEYLDNDDVHEAVPFEVAGILDASGRSLADMTVREGRPSVVLFSKDSYFVQIVVTGQTTDANEGLVRQLALNQFNRL